MPNYEGTSAPAFMTAGGGAFRGARVRRTVAGTVSLGTYVVFDETDVDTDGFVVAQPFEVPVGMAGYYRLFCQLLVSFTGSGGDDWVEANLLHTPLAGGLLVPASDGGFFKGTGGFTDYLHMTLDAFEMAEGDGIGVYFTQRPSGLVYSPGPDELNNHFSITYLGQ